MIDATAIPTAAVHWNQARRIIRSIYPPADLFEDIADPADWPLLISAEQKTNPRLMDTIGNLDLVPPDRRVGGTGASYLMAPFTHVSPDRPSRFGAGAFGVLYAGESFETALAETIHHHERFMRRTREPEGWTSQFRELVLDVSLTAHDLTDSGVYVEALDPDDYGEAQRVGAILKANGSDGILYPSVRNVGGRCVGLFYPDLAALPTQGRHLDYHWNGDRVDFYREPASGTVFEVQ
ncbi:RES family NAD+ phosphorylase [Sphingosinicella sp. LHD-64]|uniref:RES family NAD+ phosphorylase n=1 Tax=Sphingosinicella sp. LHD-64 TaxID=3072139 RepID=UPI00280EFD8C|nr:RES family NAD+ phosphorylase [Sphingosinicella sp. LHD-64]MDQ8757689.1 RES family NAD+ phosphorylase [Sphingosinicella sp. LHD-64]